MSSTEAGQEGHIHLAVEDKANLHNLIEDLHNHLERVEGDVRILVDPLGVAAHTVAVAHIVAAVRIVVVVHIEAADRTVAADHIDLRKAADLGPRHPYHHQVCSS